MTDLPTIKYGRTVDGVPCLTLTEHVELMREYRNQALEEAAKVCEQTEIVTYIYGTQVHDSGAETLSNAIDAIRALKAAEVKP